MNEVDFQGSLKPIEIHFIPRGERLTRSTGIARDLRPLNNKSEVKDAPEQILCHLHEHPALSRRALGERVGVSCLRAVNYRLKALKSCGPIKVQNFKRSPNKIGDPYFLTPAGMREATFTACFLKRKMNYGQALEKEIG